MSQILFKYQSAINLTVYSEAIVSNSLLTYDYVTSQIRAANENYNPSTYLPASTVLNPGQSVTFYVPLPIPVGRNCIWVRSLFSELEFQLTFFGASSVATFAGGATAANLQGTCSLQMVGYSFTAPLRERIMNVYAGTVITRFILPQQTTANIGQITSGVQWTTQIQNNPSLCIGINFYVRATPTTPQLAATPLANSITQITLLDGAQNVPFQNPNTDANLYRTILSEPQAIAQYSLQYNMFPFAHDPISCIKNSLSLGVYYVNIGSQLQLLSGVTNSSTELVTQYLRVTLLIQRGSALAIKLL